VVAVSACNVELRSVDLVSDAGPGAGLAGDTDGAVDGSAGVPDAGTDVGNDAGAVDAGVVEGPRLCAEPASVDFGDVLLGEKGTVELKLKACGTSDVGVTEMMIQYGTAGWFSLDQAPSTPFVLRPGEEKVVVLACAPSSTATASAQLTVTADDPALPGGKGIVRLTCRGVETPACKIKADPSRLDFGNLASGSTVQKEFHLPNVGNATCVVSHVLGPRGPEFKLVEITDGAGKIVTGQPFTIEPSYSANVRVSLTAPMVKCPFVVDEVLFSNNSVNEPELKVALNFGGGTCPVCRFKVQPLGTLNFGNVGIGAKKKIGINFENIGTDDCEITDAKLGSSAGDWFTLDQYTYPIVVQPAANTKIEVECNPNTTGPAPNAGGTPDLSGANVLNVTTTDPAQPQPTGDCPSRGWCHKLLCTGVTSVLDVLPNPVDFGTATVGCNTSEKVVSLFNNGTAVLSVTQLEIVPSVNPPSFLITSAPPTPWSIPAASAVKVKLKYRPAISGVETGTLRIRTDAPNAVNGTIDVPLRGEGTLEDEVLDVFAGEASYLPDGTFVAVAEFFLSRWPDPSTIVVTVNGVVVPVDPVNGYVHDMNANSIVFGSGAVPPEGAVITVSYRAACY